MERVIMMTLQMLRVGTMIEDAAAESYFNLDKHTD